MAILDRLSNIFDPAPRKGSRADIAIQQEVQQDIQKQNDRLAKYEMDLNTRLLEFDRAGGPSPDTGFTAEDREKYDNWRNTYNPDNPTPEDFIFVYGKEEGIQKLNELGFGQAILGMGKQLDPLNSYINEEGELVPYVRVADADQGRFYSAPFTVDGRKFSEVAEEFGPGRMPDNEELAINLKSLSPVFSKYKADVYRRPQMESFFDAVGALQDTPQVNWFEPSARTDILPILESEGMLQVQQAQDAEDLEAAGAPTEVVGGEPQPRTPAFESNPVFGSVEEFKTQFSKDRKVAAIGVTTPGGYSIRTDMDPIYVAPSKEMLEKYPTYVPNKDTHALNFSDADWENMTAAEQNNAIKYEKALQKKTLNTVMDSADKVINQPQNLGKVKNWYKSNKSKLENNFMQDPQLYEEFNADPYGFAKKYSEMNQVVLNGKPVAPSDIESLQQETVVPSTKLDKKTVNNLMEAVNSGDIVAFRDGVQTLIGDERLSETGQQKLAGLLQKYNNNLKRSTNEIRLSIVGDMAASLSDDNLQLFMPYLMRFADTGRLSFEGDKVAADQAKILLEQRKQDVAERTTGIKPTQIYTKADSLLSEISPLEASEVIGKGYGQQLSSLLGDAVQFGSAADQKKAQDAVNVFLSKAVEGLASEGFLQNNPITSWLYTDVSPKEFQLPPDVVARDGKNDPITIDRLPDVLSGNIQIKDFVIKGVGDQIQGTPVNRGQIDAAFGVDVSQMLLYNSLLANEGR
jgi:hypothetical protein